MKVRTLSDDLQKKANEELNEVASRIYDDIEHIREWIEKQPHLSIRTDDQHILSFLRGCKFSLQKTKEKLDFFYSMRTIVPEFFASRYPFSQEIQEIFKVGAVVVLPQIKGSLEPRVLLIRWAVCNVDTVSLRNLFKAILMSMDIMMNEDDNLIVSGMRLVVDYAGFAAKYTLQINPTIIAKFMLCIEKAYPIRIKGAYSINVPLIFDSIYAIAKPFTSQKFQRRVHVYKEDQIDQLYTDICRNTFPKDYGGDSASVASIAEHWAEKVDSYKQWFLEDDKYGSNEKCRPTSSKTFISGILNMEGSFRNLNVD